MFRNFPGQVCIGVIAGGDITDPASDQSGNQKVYLPMEHHPDGVKLDHLAFNPLDHSPTQHSQQSFTGALDPGSLVYFLKNTGQTGGLIIGQANDLLNYSKGDPGALNIMTSNPIIQELLKRTIGIQIPPNIKEAEEKNTKIRKIEEKGEQHRHEVLKGLPSNGALFPMSGFRLPQVKNVPTAKTKFSELDTNNILGKMPGDLMSLAKMFQGLLGGLGGGGGSGGGGQPSSGGGSSGGSTDQSPTSNTDYYFTTANATYQYSETDHHNTPMSRIKQKVDPEIFDAIMSLSMLMQGMEDSDVMTYPTDNKVHTPTFLQNAEDLLSQVTSISDLMDVLQDLQFDESLFGLENIPPSIIVTETAWGNANVTIHANGTTNLQHSSQQQNDQNNASNNMGSAQNNPSVNPGDNMFLKQAKQMFEMFKRLAPKSEKEANNMMKKLSNQTECQKNMMGICHKTVGGGNPLDPQYFK